LGHKILKNRIVSQDLRGKHFSRPHKTFFPVNEDINEFINSLPTEQTHYGRNKSSKYISPEFGSIANIYRLLIDLFSEHKLEVKYHLFNKNFKKFNISIRKTKVDICQTCDKLNVQIFNLQKDKKFDSINEIKNHIKRKQIFL
jgi:hypothetical protein